MKKQRIFPKRNLPVKNRATFYHCLLSWSISHTFPSKPIHMSTRLSRLHFHEMTKFGYVPPAGVIALTPDTYRRINGFSNMFWGWGGEDEDFYQRMMKSTLEKSKHSHEGGDVIRHDSISGRYSTRISSQPNMAFF